VTSSSIYECQAADKEPLTKKPKKTKDPSRSSILDGSCYRRRRTLPTSTFARRRSASTSCSKRGRARMSVTTRSTDRGHRPPRQRDRRPSEDVSEEKRAWSVQVEVEGNLIPNRPPQAIWVDGGEVLTEVDRADWHSSHGLEISELTSVSLMAWLLQPLRSFPMERSNRRCRLMVPGNLLLTVRGGGRPPTCCSSTQ
jgi:hypothetical protein